MAAIDTDAYSEISDSDTDFTTVGSPISAALRPAGSTSRVIRGTAAVAGG